MISMYFQLLQVDSDYKDKMVDGENINIFKRFRLQNKMVDE